MERPLRVVVVGSSVTFMVIPRATHADDEPYPGLLEEALLDRGVVARTHLHARWHATVKEIRSQTEPWIRDHLPDVVILNVGFTDCQARVLPTWLYRHTVAWLPGLSRGAVLYRSTVFPVVRSLVRHVQRALVGRVGLRLSRVPPPVFRRAVTFMIKQPLRDHGALVLVLDIDGPGPALSHWQPHIGERIEAYNRLLEDVVDAVADPRVVLLRTSELVMSDQPNLLPDGIHRSSDGHRRVAEAIADAVLRHAALVGVDPLVTRPDDRS